MNKLLYVVAGLVLICAVNLPALSGGCGAFDFGLHNLTDVTALNDDLHQRYGADPGDVLFQIGGHGYGHIGNFIIGGEGYGMFNYYTADYERPNELFPTGVERGNLSLAGGYGAVDFGWDPSISREINVIPTFMLGYGGMVTSATPQATGFQIPQSEEDTNRLERMATQGCFVVGAKLDSHYRIIFSDSGNHYAGMLVGIQAGYQQWLMPTGWSPNHTDMDDLPSATLTGPFILISIGGFGVHDDEGIVPYIQNDDK